eukprot:6279621-Prymnesium_polylepis.1
MQEALITEALTWLTSEPEGADEPLQLESTASSVQPPDPPMPATAGAGARSKAPQASRPTVVNRWAALTADDE